MHSTSSVRMLQCASDRLTSSPEFRVARFEFSRALTHNSQLTTRNCRSVLLMGLIAVSAGCAAPSSYPAFFGRYIEPIADADGAAIMARGQTHPGIRQPGMMDSDGTPQHFLVNQGGDAMTAQGSITGGLGKEWISLSVSNHGNTPVRLSYVVDEYIAKTSTNRTLVLEKGDFLNYPNLLNPGDEKTVTLLLPKDVAAHDITQLIAKINTGRTVIVLRSLGPQPTFPALSNPGPLVVAAASGMERGASGTSAALPQRVPVVSEPPIAPAPTPALPTGTVSVEVEFRQDLGSSLKAEVRWDQSDQAFSLAHGERQLFYVVPGLHELSIVSRLPAIRETQGRVPVLVGFDQPTHITLDAQARLSGVEVRVRVWRGGQAVLDQTLVPAPQG